MTTHFVCRDRGFPVEFAPRWSFRDSYPAGRQNFRTTIRHCTTARRGFALRDAIVHSQPHGGTQLGLALNELRDRGDRLIVITDEQSHDRVPAPKYGRGYVVNVASYRNGVGYGAWTHIDGWSEAVIEYIRSVEADA